MIILNIRKKDGHALHVMAEYTFIITSVISVEKR